MSPHAGADSLVEIQVTDIAHGGEGVGRVDGKAHFVPGVIPGETVVGRISKDGGSWARADLVEIRTPSADRIDPLCPHATDCGGCQWQHATYAAQLVWKRNTVISQLRHLGKIDDPPVNEVAAPGPPFGYRNRMDFKIRDGQPAMHRGRSHELIPLGVCELLDPQLAAVFSRLGDLSGVSQIILRAAANTGDRLAIVSGDIPDHAASWDIPIAHQVGKTVTGVDGPAQIREEIAGTIFRISENAFFQNNSHAAEALVSLVREALEPEATDTVLDAYAGVGLFGATLAPHVSRVLAVESNRTAARDLERNLKATGVDYRVIRGKMESVAGHLDEYPELAVADPPRTGLGVNGIDAVTAAGPRRLAYVSCDPASLARDAAILAGRGYQLTAVTPVDMFPQTFHIEAVATFELG
ncbi:MAG: class I SAM-dependent RNA methyltransferase [Acidimicrobiia bacterium]|nr:class I SAM-dependent RNA methyltransferase [Acidimicrobiia bacterium]